MWICQSREQSRRTQSMEALRRFSREQADVREFQPDPPTNGTARTAIQPVQE
jgi:hypothetical protein